MKSEKTTITPADLNKVLQDILTGGDSYKGPSREAIIVDNLIRDIITKLQMAMHDMASADRILKVAREREQDPDKGPTVYAWENVIKTVSRAQGDLVEVPTKLKQLKRALRTEMNFYKSVVNKSSS